MGNRRFSMTTYVLVGIALVALYFVGKMVTPPPAAPPKEATAASASNGAPQPVVDSPEQRKREMEKEAQETKARTEKMKQMAAANKRAPANSKAFNPTTIDTEADYWQHYDMGEKGTKEMRAKVEAALAKQKPRPNVPVMQKASPVNRSQ